MRMTMRMQRVLAAVSTAALLLTSLQGQAFAAAEETTPGGIKVSELRARSLRRRFPPGKLNDVLPICQVHAAIRGFCKAASPRHSAETRSKRGKE